MEEIQNTLKKTIVELYAVEMDVVLTPAPENTGCDFATNVAMLLAKTLKKNPMEIAEEIVRRFGETDLEVEIARPGFLNFKLSNKNLLKNIDKFEKDFTKNISSDAYSGQTVICEFSDPNPFKVLHVGHLYTSIVGEAISRVIEYAGGKVVRANFGGDIGLHVARNMYGMLRKIDQIPTDLSPEKVADLLAECYVFGTRADEDDAEAHAEIVKLNKMVFEIAEAGEGADYSGDPERARVAELYFWGRKNSYQYFENFYKRLQVKFDKYYPESTVAKTGLETVRRELKNGVYEMSDGAVVYRGDKHGLHTRVFINNNGLPTYEAKDTGLIFEKYKDFHFDKSIIITGNDIIEYMKVVLSAISQYAPELSSRTLHITHGQVKLPGNEKMSSRKGNFLRAIDVIEMVREAMEKSSDEKVLMGALKYALAKYKIGGDIIFDIKESVSMTGNSGPYLQYSAVRAKKILGKIFSGRISGELNKVESEAEALISENDSAEKEAKYLADISIYERNLMKKLMQYPDVLKETVRELLPNKICTYLYELAQEFSRFYEHVQVAGSEFELERGKIILVYLKVLTHGLNLLGIEVPEQM